MVRAVEVKVPFDDGTAVALVGTVLPWLSDNQLNDVRGAAAFVNSLQKQSEDWQRLNVEFSGRMCVAGDFNQDLLEDGHYYGSRDGREMLRAVLANLELDCVNGGVDDPLQGVKRLAVIDHVCIGNGLTVLQTPRSQVWPEPVELSRHVSDHYGVSTTIVRRRPS